MLLSFSLVLGGAATVPAYFLASSPKGGQTGTAHLLSSRMTVRVGAQWIDVEEDNEVEIQTTGSFKGPWMLEGRFTVPKGTAITGCMIWNDDTLLMGKLRGKADAEHIFDSLVPARDTSWASDPLLIEQVTDDTYALHLFPFRTNGVRRFRIRYLVPLAAGTNELSVRPIAANNIRGDLPSQFGLRLRGTTTGVKIVRGTNVWPVDLPSYQLVDLDSTTDVRLRWPAGPSGDGTCAIRGKIDSGMWKGEFALFTGAVPDSILRRTALRTETVVLWRWISPTLFFARCYNPTTGDNDGWCPNEHGSKVIEQAALIGQIADRSVQNSGKIGLVADEGMDDTTIVFPLSDSTTTSYRNMRLWLSSINDQYLDWRIPKPEGEAPSGIANNLEISKNRERFRTDIQRVGALYSADSGVLRHLLVVTVGPVPVAGEFLEMPDLSKLPKGVSIGSSQLVPGEPAWQPNGSFGPTPPPISHWPGVDLQGAVQARDGGADVVSWNGIPLARTREKLSGRLTIKAGTQNISRDIVVRSNGRGGLNTSLNAHGPSLGTSITWALFNEHGDTLSRWSETPAWLRVDRDSVLPRLWGRSEAPLSPSFEDIDHGPLFGFVNRVYSLLATPSDTMGRKRQEAYRDSGLPFLSWSDIFWRQGYKPGGVPTGIDARSVASRALSVAFVRSSRALRFDLAGIEGLEIEIRDLRGRLLASFPASSLGGGERPQWRVPAWLGKGMLVVTMRSPRATRTMRVLID
jgi:hypothetical protein